MEGFHISAWGDHGIIKMKDAFIENHAR